MKTHHLGPTAGTAEVPARAASSASRSVPDQAIAWAVRLESGATTDHERAACAHWRAASAQHEQAWQQVQGIEQAFRDVLGAPTGPHRRLASDTLQAAGRLRSDAPTRRRVVKLLGWGLLSVGAGVIGARLAPGQQRDTYATAVGERRRVVLVDGSTMWLNTGSEVEVVFSPLRRLIVLHRGEVFIDTGTDAPSVFGRRPFWLETPEARLEALGTRFGVKHEHLDGEGRTRLHVTEGRVAVHAGVPPVMAVAGAGEALLVHGKAGRPQRQVSTDFDANAWLDGMLVARQMRLDALVAELARYRTEPLRCAPAVGALRVSGVFRLDGPDAVGLALKVLARTLPVKVVRAADGATSVVAA